MFLNWMSIIIQFMELFRNRSFIFIGNGFDTCKADPLNILEIGFGTGLNALLTAISGLKGRRIINYTSIEKYPLDDEII